MNDETRSVGSHAKIPKKDTDPSRTTQQQQQQQQPKYMLSVGTE
jgi:hypothetical protein